MKDTCIVTDSKDGMDAVFVYAIIYPMTRGMALGLQVTWAVIF